MMLDVFTKSSMPFYKFGDLLFLEKITTEPWVDFIAGKFRATGKSISKENVELICTLADNHPYYVQQLSQQSWLRTDKQCSAEIIHEAHEAIVAQLSLLFVTITESLTANQLNLLRSIIAGARALSSTEVMSTYRLGNSSNVARARKALIEKDILDDKAGGLLFQDPMYRHWLAVSYFPIQ
jgi:hypothetical protein